MLLKQLHKLFVILLLLQTATSYAQRRGNGIKSFKPEKQFIFGAAASNFFGDLGGLNRVGTHLSPLDLDFVATRPSGHIGYRYIFRPHFATTSKLTYALLRGDDMNTNEPYRRNRNLSFRTHLIELSQRLEVILYNNSNKGYTAKYKIKGVKGIRFKSVSYYIYSGISGFAYIPQGPIDGGWKNLRPLNTEGQGLPGGGESYGIFGLGIPMGIGVRLGLDPIWRMSIEFSYTQTFTDYLDDVSGVYYNNAAIEASYGSTSAYFADPSSGSFPTWTSPGELRGDSNHDDGYAFLNISIIRDLSSKRTKRIKFNYRRRARF